MRENKITRYKMTRKWLNNSNWYKGMAVRRSKHGRFDPRQDDSAGLADKSTGRRRFMSGGKVKG